MLHPGDEVFMYGVLVGKAQTFIPEGGVITTSNVKHAANSFDVGERKLDWHKPDVSKFMDRTFYGFSPRRWQSGYSQLLARYSTGIL